MTIGNISGRTETMATQNSTISEGSSATSLPAAPSSAPKYNQLSCSATLRRWNGLPPSFGPKANETMPRPTPLSSEILQIIDRFLRDPDLVELPHKKFEDPVSESQKLPNMPRESRFRAFQHTIMEWVKRLPNSQTGGCHQVSTRLKALTCNQVYVDAFHEDVSEIMNAAPENRVQELQKKCWRISGLPKQHRSDAFDAILDNTEDPRVLGELIDVIRSLPQADQSAKWHALMDNTQDPKALLELADIISELPEEKMSAAWHALLAKTEDPQVLQVLAHVLSDFPKEKISAALIAILEKTEDPQVSKKLTEVICRLPQAEQIAGLHALLDRTEDQKTLEDLVWNLTDISPENRCAGWNAILGKTNNWSVIDALETTIGYLPKKDQDAATQAIRKARNPFA